MTSSEIQCDPAFDNLESNVDSNLESYSELFCL